VANRFFDVDNYTLVLVEPEGGRQAADAGLLER
jgi:hypothetical protein